MRRRLTLAAGCALGVALVISTAAFGAEWTRPARVTPIKGSALTALHELASTPTALHLVHGRPGPAAQDDHLSYQRSTDGGRTWSAERVIAASTAAQRVFMPNLAIAAQGDLVVVAWRSRGPAGTSLFVRRSEDGGDSWRSIQPIASTSVERGLGVPALALAEGVVIVAWTDRGDGDVQVRRSTDGGRSYGEARTLGRSGLSITCAGKPLLDGLVGLASAADTIHLAWSEAPAGDCIATAVRVRTSTDAGRTWQVGRIATSQRSFGWPELTARARRLLLTVQRPDGGLIVVRSVDAGTTFAERQVKPPTDHALGAADVVMPGGSTAWLVYADLTYDGDDVRSSRVRFRESTDGGATWGAPTDAVAGGPKLRQAANVGFRFGLPVVVVASGPLTGATSDIVVVRRQ